MEKNKSEESSLIGNQRAKKEVTKVKRIEVRLTEFEHEKLLLNAEKSNMKPSPFLREIAINGEVKARLTQEEKQHLRMLFGIAQNLNQIAKKYNSGQLVEEELKNTLSEIHGIISKLK